MMTTMSQPCYDSNLLFNRPCCPNTQVFVLVADPTTDPATVIRDPLSCSDPFSCSDPLSAPNDDGTQQSSSSLPEAVSVGDTELLEPPPSCSDARLDIWSSSPQQALEPTAPQDPNQPGCT